MALSTLLCVFRVPSGPIEGPTHRVHSLLFILLIAASHFCQAQQPQSDPKAVAFASQAITALTAGSTIKDVTLTGTVTWSGPSGTESGTATLLALGTGESRIDMALPDGTHSQIRDSSTGVPLGEWIAPSGAHGFFPPQNCATDAVWFYPALGSLASGPGVVLAYVGQENRNDATVQHIQSYVYQYNPSGLSPTPQQLSTMDFYLDAVTLLPVAIVFNNHPDNNANINLPVEVDFLSYRTIAGVLVPAHVQKLLQGNLIIDLTVSGAALNIGLPLSDFTISN